jgi:hypothetical protein
MSNETGGPAFPLHPEIRPTLDKEWCGMTLRDYFAAKALPTTMQTWKPDEAARLAYEQADAMLEARKW